MSSSFSKTVASFGKQTGQKVDRVRRVVTLKLLGSVVLDTPVDTGRLRGNWRPSESMPLTEEIDREDKGGQAVMREIEDLTSISTGDNSIFLTNNLPYAGVAEYGGWNGPTKKVTDEGYSRQSPAGMVRKNVVRFNQLIKIEAGRKS
jgi:hypothetical protein